jgi:hypothetical protein
VPLCDTVHTGFTSNVRRYKKDGVMETLKITVDDQQTKDLVVRMLHSIKGVNIEERKCAASISPVAALKELSGIWSGRDVTLAGVREKAWRRGSTV